LIKRGLGELLPSINGKTIFVLNIENIVLTIVGLHNAWKCLSRERVKEKTID
jgi:hypothetical protein